ncbi:MAG: hypothetical protein ACRDLB_04630 [Actinomycetota bacterium]
MWHTRLCGISLLLVLIATGCTSTSSAEAGQETESGAAGGTSTSNEDDAAGERDRSAAGDAAGAGPTITASGRWVGAQGVKADPPDDAQVTGTVPDFVDILEGSVVGSADGLTLTLVMSGDVPETMPDDTTHTIVAWNLAAARKAPTVGITAQVGEEGWTVSAAVDNEPADWPGELSIEGNAIELSLPWGFVSKPHAFDWSAATTYYATSSGETSGAADNIPEARFPARRK